MKGYWCSEEVCLSGQNFSRTNYEKEVIQSILSLLWNPVIRLFLRICNWQHWPEHFNVQKRYGDVELTMEKVRKRRLERCLTTGQPLFL